MRKTPSKPAKTIKTTAFTEEKKYHLSLSRCFTGDRDSTPLLRAACYGDLKKVKRLLKDGEASIKERSFSGLTALLSAARGGGK